MNIAILDDELHCVESLLFHIRQLFPDFKVAYKGTNPVEALKSLKELDIDLLFLDVEMPGMNGFEFLEQFDKLPFDVIFTTAYSQYAIQAFKAQANNYLLKPIDEDELEEAINQWLEKSPNSEESSAEICNLLNHLKKENLLKNKIAVPVSDGLEFVEIKNILYCQSQNNYTSIFLKNGEKLFICRTLKDVENSLKRFLFLRVHQSYLINPSYMQKYIRNDGGYILMSNDQSIPISSSKKAMIAEIFDGINS
ncbi:Transcriptional regulatory protein BtsR [Arenibacter antarcticus]|uniref:LytR/AlgR family response regulator transcription factor n=1 Tax=Arenibacter antarcticus TaxID=2040469 RepID=A0ABW5VCC3_9FLAO|nr:LytTR family DNA-binding domain-containing protein [Arenibacter sp. H213]MCM4167546.1 DNA-binding response regulator [Arenibacter sp. H213]